VCWIFPGETGGRKEIYIFFFYIFFFPRISTDGPIKGPGDNCAISVIVQFDPDTPKNFELLLIFSDYFLCVFFISSLSFLLFS